MSIILHISDPHFGTEQENVMRALIDLSHEQQPDLIVVSGDITQRARRSQFRAARQFVDHLATPHLLVIPGNHDIPLFNIVARVLFPYANYQRAFGRNLQPSFASEDVMAIGVNTTRPYRHIDGEVSSQQIDHVVTLLHKATPQQLRIVVTHQPIYVVRREDEENLLDGHQHAVYAWAEAGADVILGGHIHLPYVSPLHHHFEGLAREVWLVQAGTAVSTRIRWGTANSINVIRYTPTYTCRRCVVERWDYADTANRFCIAQSQEIQPL